MNRLGRSDPPLEFGEPLDGVDDDVAVGVLVGDDDGGGFVGGEGEGAERFGDAVDGWGFALIDFDDGG